MTGVSASMMMFKVGTGAHLFPTPKTQSSFLTAAPSLRLPTLRVAAYGGGAPILVERAISAASYALPFLNTLQYGRRLFSLYPAAAAALVPLVSLYRSIPYGSFIGFLALYAGVARNPAAFSRFARFNAMQAVTLDVLFVLAGILARALSPRFSVWAQDGVFVLSCLCFVYGFVNCVIGRMPHLPLVGDAASTQLH